MHRQQTSEIGLMKLPVQTEWAIPDHMTVLTSENEIAKATCRKLTPLGVTFEMRNSNFLHFHVHALYANDGRDR